MLEDENTKLNTTGMDDKAWKLVTDVVNSGQKEQQKARRWGVVFKCLTFTYLFSLLFVFQPTVEDVIGKSDEEYAAIIQVHGEIASKTRANAREINGALKKAFENENTKGIILDIDSGGGSPVQSGLVYDEIKRLRIKHPDIKVYAVLGDVAASGAYYIASAADEIYADKASIVGSIGVIAGGFGFTEIMDKFGVERRAYTSGEHKSLLDPFLPENPNEVAFWNGVLKHTHGQFINAVKTGRGDRLKDMPEIFSGLVWPGDQAQEIGLVDGLGSIDSVARDIIGVEKTVVFTKRLPWIQQFTGNLGASFADGVLTRLKAESEIQLR